MLELDHSRPLPGFTKLLDADIQRFPIGRIECAFRPTFLEHDAILQIASFSFHSYVMVDIASHNHVVNA